MANRVYQTSEIQRAYNRAWYQRHREKQLAYLKQYQQEHRERLREYNKKRYLAETEERRRQRLVKLKERYANDPGMRARIQAQAKTWRVSHREDVREQSRLNDAIRQQRERANGGLLSRNIRQQLQGKQRQCCAICGMHMKRSELDHIVPVVNGGPSSDGNVQLVCPTCNKRKGVK